MTKRTITIGIMAFIMVVNAISAAENPSAASATTDEPGYSEGRLSIRTSGISGDDDSAKFDEYTDLSQSVTGDAQVGYTKPNTGFLRFTGSRIGADDQNLDLFSDWYGKMVFGLTYDQLPHRFAENTVSLYNGIGSDYLTIDDTIQTTLAPLTGSELADRLNLFYEGAASHSLTVDRDNLKLITGLTVFSPFSFRMELFQDEKTGKKPLMASFGLNGFGVDPPVEIVEPVDSVTRRIRLLAEYANNDRFLNLSYDFSHYDNRKDSVSFENPFNPVNALFDPAIGRIALSPDNRHHSISLAGGYSGLPFHTRLTGAVSLGRMTQDNSFIPYSINSALVPPSTPFDATDPGNLPQENPDARVDTALYHFTLVSRPADLLRIKTHFRYWEYDNESERIEFPGYVANDDFFFPIPLANSPISYRHLNTGAELGLNMPIGSQLTIGYKFDRTGRMHTEVNREDEHSVEASVDAFVRDRTDIRLSYSRSYKNIDAYDLTEGSLTQLPQLRKYTMADRVRDRVELLAHYYPLDNLIFGSSVVYTRDDFRDSPFGLQKDNGFAVSIDTDWEVTKKATLYGGFVHEWRRAEQKASDEIFDPETAAWTADTTDIFDTILAGMDLVFIPGVLDAGLSYSYTIADGKIDLNSVAASPSDFGESDDAVLQFLDSRLNYHMRKDFSLTLGYQWRKMNYDDFNTQGFQPVAVNIVNESYTPLVDGLFMDTLPEDYDAHLVYATVTYTF